MTLTVSDTHKIATVRVTNHTGHKLPTGYPEGRQMWLHLQAYDAGGQVIYESGAYDAVSGQLDRDADVKVYESQAGHHARAGGGPGQAGRGVLSLCAQQHGRQRQPHPAAGLHAGAFDRPGLRPVGASYADGQYWDDTVYELPPETERVVATLYYQTASKEYVDFLRSRGGVDGLSLGALWDSSKSPPVAMARAWTPGYDLYMPVIFK